MVGLAVNAASVLLLGVHDQGQGHDHHGHRREDHHDVGDHDHDHDHDQHRHGRGHDLNLRSAYLHVLADALTSVLAIVALLAGKFFGAWWMDPLMGVVGAALVTEW